VDLVTVVMIAQLVISYILLLMLLMKFTLLVKTHVHMDTGVTLLHLQKFVLFVTNLVVLVTIKVLTPVLNVVPDTVSTNLLVMLHVQMVIG
jgi:hypothetical protein